MAGVLTMGFEDMFKVSPWRGEAVAGCCSAGLAVQLAVVVLGKGGVDGGFTLSNGSSLASTMASAWRRHPGAWRRGRRRGRRQRLSGGACAPLLLHFVDVVAVGGIVALLTRPGLLPAAHLQQLPPSAFTVQIPSLVWRPWQQLWCGLSSCSLTER
ncbi:unnamed protein product [Urochloa humidicola]